MDVVASEGFPGRPASPVVLIATGNWWALAARIAIAFVRQGWTVVASCPPGSPLHYVSRVTEIFPLGILTSRASLVGAIRKIQPDLIVPCDDSTVFLLHEIHTRHADLRQIIERSLGHPDAYSILASREQLQREAADLGIRVPRGCALNSAVEAAERFADFPLGAAVKLDGTYGGEGVAIVGSRQEAARAFDRARLSTKAAVAIKRALVNRDPYAIWNWKRKERARISMQEYIVGTPANIMVACWKGKVLAHISAEALSCQGATGAANLVRRIDRPEFRRNADALAARLGLSGFFGLDFVIERCSGLAYLIEMNPRCTQLGHLRFPDQNDLASALCERVSGRRSTCSVLPIRDSVIAFFPQTWRWKSRADLWSSVFHDIPWGEDALINELLSEPWPDRQWAARLYHWIRPPQRVEAAGFEASSKRLICPGADRPLASGESMRR